MLDVDVVHGFDGGRAPGDEYKFYKKPRIKPGKKTFFEFVFILLLVAFPKHFFTNISITAVVRDAFVSDCSLKQLFGSVFVER